MVQGNVDTTLRNVHAHTDTYTHTNTHTLLMPNKSKEDLEVNMQRDEKENGAISKLQHASLVGKKGRTLAFVKS